jgi:signal transduction histidine kinase
MGTDLATGERVMSVSSPLLFSDNQVIGVMRYVTSLEKVNRQILYSIGFALGVAFLVMAIVIVSNLYFIRSIVVPVQELNEIAKKIAAGSYGDRLEKHFNDEIGELCDAINNMSSEISAAERIKTEFISSVSHELRTPLTAIAGWSETLLSGDIDDPPEIRKGIRIILNEARRLSKLVEELLEFTRMEGGRFTLQMEEADVLPEFEEAVFMYMETLKKDGITLEYSAADDIPNIVCDRARLRQVFLNILDNAAKHGGSGKRIDASIRTDSRFITIAVRDYGAGIPPEELPRVKLKFYKGSSKMRGSGIGLAVSDEIVRLHGGTLDIESKVGEGTTVTIRLPIKPSSGR